MPITDKTRQEMEAGAAALASQRGGVTLPEGYMEAILRTADRRAQLQAWANEGRISVEFEWDYSTGRGVKHYVIRIGTKIKFDTRETESDMGSFPSEFLIAKIALALEARQDKV